MDTGPGHATYMPNLHISDTISSNFEFKNNTNGMLLDLTKAFDVIDHNILLHKLSYYDMKGIVLNWFPNYLSNRKQYAVVNGPISMALSLICR